MNQREAVEKLAKWLYPTPRPGEGMWNIVTPEVRLEYLRMVRANVASLFVSDTVPERVAECAIEQTHATIAALVAGAGEKP